MTQKKKKAGRSKKTINISFFFRYLTGKKLKTVAAILLLCFAFYFFIALISSLYHAGADRSIVDSTTGDIIGKASIKAQNWAGKGGAWLANKFVNDAFGFPSIIFTYIFILLGLRLFRPLSFSMVRHLAISTFLIIWGSITLGFFFSDVYSDAAIYPGGAYGYFIADWLDALLGGFGTFLLIAVSMLIFFVVAFENSIEMIKRIIPKRLPSIKKISKQDDDELVETPKTVQQTTPAKEILEQTIEDIELNDVPFERIDEEIEQPQAEVTPTTESGTVELNTDIPTSTHPDKALPIEEQELEVTVATSDEDEVVEQRSLLEDYDPTLDLSDYQIPSVDLLEQHGINSEKVSNEELISNKNRIVETLKNYKIEITKIKATIGPTVTLYEIVPAPGVRIAKIKNLEDDIALSLAALGIRIIAPIPGKGTIGIEVPNRRPEVVSMHSIIASKKFQDSNYELPIALGKTITNETFVVDLAKMPHVLVAGATGQGKSVGLNAIITSLLYKKHPSQLKFVFVDPKKVELNLYSSIEKHFLAKLPDEEEPIITDITKVKNTLNSLNIEMDARYDLLKKAHARNIKEYNKKFITRKLNPEKGHHYMPYIVLVVDEFADLIMTAGKDIEMPIARIAQLARAVGIHMIIATQRPSTNIITGVIKANFPSRIAFKVASMIDSRTILDQPGANQLIGKGDMLISVGSDVTRVQCAFVDTPEVEAICDSISEQRSYPTAFMLPEYVGDEGGGEMGAVDTKNKDEFFEEAARLVTINQSGSTSLIQRKFSIGYNRAGRIMDQLEACGIVGPSEGSKARQVLINDEYALEQLLDTL